MAVHVFFDLLVMSCFELLHIADAAVNEFIDYLFCFGVGFGQLR
jgi:hypothetical protein